MPDRPVTTWACTNKVGGRPSIAPRACGSPTARRGWCHVVRHRQDEGGISSLIMNGDSRKAVLDNALLRVLAVTPLSALTAPLAPSDDGGRQQLDPSASDVCCSAPASAAFASLRPSGGTGELSMIQVDGGLCRLRLGPTPAPAASNGDRASSSRSRRTWQIREALPHGHSVADCPLLQPSRRLPQPGLMTSSEGRRDSNSLTPSRASTTIRRPVAAAGGNSGNERGGSRVVLVPIDFPIDFPTDFPGTSPRNTQAPLRRRFRLLNPLWGTTAG